MRSTRLLKYAAITVTSGVLVAFVCAQYYPYSYNPNANLLSYFPPQFLPYFTPTMTSILGGIPANQLPTLFNALSSYSNWPNFLQMLQMQSPALYNAFNQLQYAYGHNYPLLYPANQAILQGLTNGFGAVMNNAMYGMNWLNPAALQNFNQYMPGLSNFFFNPGFQSFANQYFSRSFPPYLLHDPLKRRRTHRGDRRRAELAGDQSNPATLEASDDEVPTELNDGRQGTRKGGGGAGDGKPNAKFESLLRMISAEKAKAEGDGP